MSVFYNVSLPIIGTYIPQAHPTVEYIGNLQMDG